VNRYGISALAQACKNGSAAMVKMLLDAGADINVTLKGGETVLMLASRSGNAEAVQMLLGRHANPNAKGTTRTDGVDVGRGRRAHGDRSCADGGGRRQERENRVRVYAILLCGARRPPGDGARLSRGRRRCQRDDAASPGRGRTSPGSRRTYESAAPRVQNAHFELAIALIDAGADPNDQRTGFTPLHLLPGVRKPDSSDGSDGAAPVGAGRLSSLEFVREIVKRGAKVNFRLPPGSPRMPATSSQIATSGATPCCSPPIGRMFR
jgi:hypothetical protein